MLVTPGPEVIKRFPVLNSGEHEIDFTYKYSEDEIYPTDITFEMTTAVGI